MTRDLFDFQPSPQQAAFLDFVACGQGNAVLEACAGAGKTSTLIQGVSRMAGTKFLGAFNKAIAAELRKRVQSTGPANNTAVASTMHSAGLAAWRKRFPKAAVVPGKARKVFRQLAGERGFDRSAFYADFVEDMVSYAMNAGLGLDDPREIEDDQRWRAISSHFDADRSLDKGGGANEQTGIRWARLTFKRSLEMCPETLSFDEMLYAPLYGGVRTQQFDNVLIDEAQDSSVPRILLAGRMLAERGRLVAVGDRYQSIYGFAGADASAIQNIIERFDCTVLPLSVSFRCPRAVVWYAQQFVGLHIEPAQSANEGISRRIRLYPGWWRDDKPGPHDAILCRFNAPLVSLAFAFLRDGIPCRMAGRDELGATLKQLIKRRDSRSIEAVEARLRDWLSEEIEAARLRDKPARANAAQDMVDTMQIIIDRCRNMGHFSVHDLLAEIDQLFVKPKQPSVLLSSIHKAKGREWPRVYWMQTMPKFIQPKEWQQRQEMNLKYVAATRAMHELVTVQE